MSIEYSPGISYRGDEYAFRGIQNLGIGLGDALKTWQKKQEEAQKLQADVQRSDFVVQHAKQSNLISAEDWNTYQTGNAKAKLAIADGISQNLATDLILKQQQAADIANRIRNAAMVANTNLDAQKFTQTDQLFPLQKQATEAGLKQSQAATNLAEAKAWQEWTGTGGDNPTLTLSPAEIAAGKAVGKVALRMSRGSFQWAQDPELAGSTMGNWIKDPNDPSKYIGMMQADGNVKFLPRPSDIVELISRGIIKLPEGKANPPLQAAETPVPTAPPKSDPASIKAAFKAGTITRDQAKQQLQALGYQ